MIGSVFSFDNSMYWGFFTIWLIISSICFPFAVTENGTRGQKLELISNRLMSQKTNFETLKSENEDIVNKFLDNIADFFESLTTSKEFILLEDGTLQKM